MIVVQVPMLFKLDEIRRKNRRKNLSAVFAVAFPGADLPFLFEEKI